MRTIVYTNPNGVSITFGNGSTYYGISDLTGLGVPEENIQSQRAPFQDGTTPIDRLLNPREITMSGVIMVGNAMVSMYTRRRELCASINPKLGVGSLIYTNDYGSWLIDATPIGPIFANNNANEGSQKYQITFYCEDPYWKDVNETTVTINSASLSASVNITGDVPCPVTIEMTGISRMPKVSEIVQNVAVEYAELLDKKLTVETSFGRKSATIEGVNDFDIATSGVGITSIASDDSLGMFCLVGGGIIRTSADGYTWTSRLGASSLVLNGVTHHPQYKFCAVGQSGRVITSPDGVTWTPRTAVVATQLRSVAAHPTLGFCAVGDGGVILTSPTGVAWTVQSSGVAVRLNSVTIHPTLGFCAVGVGGAIVTSPTGVTWTAQTSGTVLDLFSVASHLTLGFCAVGTGGGYNAIKLTSPTGVTWTSRTSGFADGFTSVVSHPTIGWCAVGSILSTGGVILTSPTGVTWTVQSSGITTYHTLITYNQKLDTFLVYGASANEQAFLKSQNAVTWESEVSVITIYNLRAITNHPSLGFCSVSEGGTIHTSPNGVAWTTRISGISSILRGVAAHPTLGFCAVGDSGVILTSPTGVTWTVQSSGVAVELRGVAAHPAFGFCAVGVGGTILTSSTGVTWTAQTSGTVNALYGVASHDSLGFCAAGATSPFVLTSPNGIAWTNHVVSLSGGGLNGIASHPSLGFCAVGGTNAYTSVDGSAWVSYLGITTSLIIAVGSSLELGFCATTIAGVVKTSFDGVTWTTITSGIDSVLYGVTSSPDAGWVAVGASGNILISSTASAVNAIHLLSSDSTFFSLAPGKNVIVASSEAGVCYATVKYRNRYIGV